MKGWKMSSDGQSGGQMRLTVGHLGGETPKTGQEKWKGHSESMTIIKQTLENRVCKY